MKHAASDFAWRADLGDSRRGVGCEKQIRWTRRLGSERLGLTELSFGPPALTVAWPRGRHVAERELPIISAYATERVHKAAQVVKLPDSVAYEAAAAIMLQGLTVRYLLKNSYPVQRGETVLWHAAAGGRGSYRLSMG